jgi:photosystem II stability/assembly factor-like uncharacterized protein
MKKLLLSIIPVFIVLLVYGQSDWTVCNTPAFSSRADDIFMVNTKTGYAVTGDGLIMKTTDGGNNWTALLRDNSVYCRSVEFADEQNGFVGAFPIGGSVNNILRRTTDGGANWTDLTPLLHPKARKGICGLSVAAPNTIYGCGNWYMDSAYIIKSTDGGNSWNYIDMSAYGSSLIDFYFLNKDTGFVTGKGPLPLEQAVILYTTDGGARWSVVYSGGLRINEYCWKISRLTERTFFASIQSFGSSSAKVLRSSDGGKSWSVLEVTPTPYNIEGIGFINPLTGWVGGGAGKSFETRNGGLTWDSIPVCPYMNRVFKVNDTMLFASGDKIWRYKGKGTYPALTDNRFISLKCHPNPVRNMLTINVGLKAATHLLVALLDENGRRIATLDNADRPAGSHQFYFDVTRLQAGVYFVAAMSHEDKEVQKVLVAN